MRRSALGLNLLAAAIGMFLLAYASVPLYRLFCEATGYNGTPQRAKAAPGAVSSRMMTVRFNADIDPSLAWEFKPDQAEIAVKIGEQAMTHFLAKNKTDARLRGHATFNVLPFEAGQYFTKIQCFCFTDQTLSPHQEVHMPVLFFIDPAILKDEQLKDLSTITLSYTFFPTKE